MRTIEVTLYQFDELPTDAAKERARAWWRECVGNDPAEITESISDLVTTAAGLLGITIDTRRGSRSEPAIYWDTNPIGGAFDGSWSMPRASAPTFGAAIREEFPGPQFAALHRIADSLDAIHATVTAADPEAHAYATIRTRRGCAVDVESCAELSDDDATEPDICDDLGEALSDFAHWIGTLASAECEYRASDEYVDGALTVNKYEFTAEGDRA